ncbi:MAG: S9 family peptidase [Bacteroidetes bacterium]|nr:S9 family peptidase [Bacteroidota bacterium]
MQSNMIPPKPAKKPKTLEKHGDIRIDEYYWLNERENPEVLKYLKQENEYFKSEFAHNENFQNQLFEEIKGRIKKTDESVPYKYNGYWYYTRYENEKEYPIYCRKKDTLENEEIIILDVNDLAKGYQFIDVTGLTISEDNNILAYSTDTLSRRIYTIHFKNLETGEILPDKIENTNGTCCWANDSKHVFYSVKDNVTLRSHKIFRKQLGKNSIKLIYEEKDNTFNTYIYKSKSKKYLIIGSDSTLASEFRILNADKPNGKFKIFFKRQKKHEYSIAHFNDRFYIITNYKAKNFRLMVTPENQTNRKYWMEVIPNRPETMIEGIELFKDFIVIDERTNGLTQLRIINNKDKKEHYLDFGEPVYSAGVSVNPEFDSTVLRYGYTSLTTPNSTIEYNLITKEKKILKQQEIIGGYNADEYQTERIFATAKDKTQIPISLVYKKSLKKPDGNPLLLYGYGSYGASLDVYFSSVRLSLLNRGFIVAIAHIRGGQELGRKWYENGKLFKKKNTFNDFIASAKKLIEIKYTTPKHLYAMGGSAGGLLMGAILNMQPHLWNGMIAQVPFVDVLTTMLDDSIPLTTGEYDEWGNPNIPKYYKYIKSYSPYDNIKPAKYPSILVTTGLHDSQVQYWEPAKWVTRLRENNLGKNKILFFINLDTGHGGASGRFERLKEVAMEYAFLLDLEGIKK